MKIVLIGYGKMGKMIEQVSLQKGHSIVGRICSNDEISRNTIGDADVCIDFTHPSCVMDNIKKTTELRKNLVVGTTGWYDNLEQARKVVEASGIGFLYAPNFSVGVHLFMKIVSEAACLVNDNYDVAGLEAHHREKVDQPSGTAKALAAILKDKIREDIPFTSLRCGSIPGTHSIIFDSPVDSITLTHQARNREGFAQGAVAAAEWLIEKKGFYTLEDMLT